jgi:cytochrome c-type biogenesis protein CcmH/NrfG
MDRLATLREFVTRTPDDPFPRYGLAMELKNRGEVDEACQVFEHLLEKMPDYVPTYLMYGNTLAARGERARAAEVYRTGAQVSLRRGDSHAHAELQGALAEIEAAE